MEHVTTKNTIVLKRLVAFMPEFLIRITASSADSRGKRKLMIYNKKKASNFLEAFQYNGTRSRNDSM